MTIPVCPRCQRANPAGSVYCYFDGATLQPGADGARARLAEEFVFPSGRRCRTFDELAQGCQEEWPAARDLLRQGGFQRFFSGIGRHDLARAAQEAQALTNGDIGLTRFVGALPATRLAEAKMDIHPRRIAPGPVPAGEQRQFQLVVNNLGQATLQGTITVSEGAEWIKLEGGASQCAVNAPREQRLSLTVITEGLQAAQSYLGKLIIVTNGGIVEVPVGMDVVAQPYPKPPFQGARTPRELAEKMRVQPKAAGPALEGEVQRWFTANGWRYPVIGAPAKGVAGVQQFFEAMGLSKPPPVQLSQSEVRIVGQYPQTVRFQVSLQTTARKWVYGQVTSEAPWLKVLTPQIAGPQKAAISLEIDTQALRGGRQSGSVQVLANAGQKLTLQVHGEVQSVPGRAPAGLLGPILSMGLAFLLLRLALLPAVDLGGRAAVVDRAVIRLRNEVPSPDSPFMKIAGWLQLPWMSILAGADTTFSVKVFNPEREGEISAREFRHYYASYLVRSLVIWTWWIGALAGAVVMWRRGAGGDLLWGVIAGAVAGVMASATVACVFLVLEIVPHFLAELILSDTASGMGAWLVWVVLALLGWTVAGLLLGVILWPLPPLRAWVLAPVQRAIMGLFRACGLRGLARLCAA
jgi:hypothetical protein